MSHPIHIAQARRAWLLSGGLALLGSVFLVAAHWESSAHCGFEEPDHRCDLCRAVDGNPTVPTVPTDLLVPRAVTCVAASAIHWSGVIDLPALRDRAPPVAVPVS